MKFDHHGRCGNDEAYRKRILPLELMRTLKNTPSQIGSSKRNHTNRYEDLRDAVVLAYRPPQPRILGRILSELLIQLF